ncbi:cilia- and flagella-associated protein 47 [Alligator mississippiensis]|uniref:cilia- and flagella-associated protein 47 n=1 Tax=Alligator mississippiensis TaxID=8496 RepID=UPI002877F94C|nr:cilia- and flagella-associated protein 47 [Alligator mississippiensis]
MAGPGRDVAGLRVCPAELRFPDAVPGGRYRAQLCVQNLQAGTRRLRLLQPRQPQFKLFVDNPNKSVASGLQVTATVEYHPDCEEDLLDRLLLLVEEDVIDIPLIGLIPRCFLEIEPKINFGTVIANSKIISKEISITNHGSSPGAFKITYSGSVPLNILPTSGVVEPKAVHLVKVDICTDIPRIIREEAIVELQDRGSTELRIEATVVEQILELLGASHGNILECINFGSVYFGSSKTEEVVLCNKSPETMNWVAVLEDDAVGGEMGTDIQKSTDAVLQDINFLDRTRELDVCSLISCIPNQGTLQPYQKTVIMLYFSPKQFKRDTGPMESPSRQDYALFLRFETVGSTDGFLQLLSGDDRSIRKRNLSHCVELALTGSGLPVILTFSPGPVINFMDCFMGENTQILCTLKNVSESLPVTYSFRKIAHFRICPRKGKIKEKCDKDVMFSFSPTQVGTFKVKQVVDIIGLVIQQDNLQTLKKTTFHQINLNFTGVCKSKPKKIVFKINSGITPMISNATGYFIADEMGQYSDPAPVAMLKSAQTQIHTHTINRNCKSDALIAFPNDRSASIRPSERHKKYRTIFTKTERYHYVDPDFAYTDYEELEKQAHKEYYTDFIQSLRQHRLQKEVYRQYNILNNPINIGLKPGAGLKSPKISMTDLLKEKLKPETSPLNEDSLLTSRKLSAIESKSSPTEVCDGLNAVPASPQEKEDCNLTLTPKQLHQILVGPSTIDFGEVCVYSTSIKKIHIINNLSVHIWIQVEIASEELQQTSPLSHVVPPLSKTYIPVVYEPSILGGFQKSVSYTINNKHMGHILVTAKSVPVALELSAKELILNPTPGFLAETGFRATIRLYNRRNYFAEFTWTPVITDKGIAFSIRPAKGIVEAYKDLECEVVWHPGFCSPETGEFNLCVHQGKALKLKCLAKLGPTSVQFMEQRISFHHAPLGLTTCKTAILQNTGYNHAYFQVLDSNPVPGMTIVPSQGIIPVGGRSDLKIYFTPNAVMKFDTRVEVAVRHTKALELRIGGSVETPEVGINIESFNFDGVYVGSTHTIPFLLQNKGVACARVEFDLSKYKDFKLNFNDQSVVDHYPQKPYSYSVELKGKSTLQCSISFTPKEVAAYDFSLPISINCSEVPPSQQSSEPTTPGSVKHIIVPRPQMVTMAVPLCTVQATVLKPPLQFSTAELIFSLHSRNINLDTVDESQSTQKLGLKNTSRQQLTWKLDLDSAGKAVEDGVFKFSLCTGVLVPRQKTSVTVSFCPPFPGIYTAEVAVFLNDSPYQYKLSLSGTVKSPKISFDPPILILMPVPLDMKTGTDVNIIPLDYPRQSALRVEIPELEPEGGNGINPLSVQFPQGQVIAVSSDGSNVGLTCHISFRSSKPLSFLGNIFFIDEDENRFLLQVAATAENCLLTAYPYLAFHRTDQQIILRSDHNGITHNSAETILHPCYDPGSVSHSTSSSSFGAITSSTYEDSPSELENAFENEREKNDEDARQSKGRENTFEQSLFPDGDRVESIFFQKVLTAIQNWFTLFGWSKGPNPISIPCSLRRDICKVQMTSSQEKGFKQNLGKDTKTIYDMLLHLSGQLLPGITTSQSLPSDPLERVVQLHWQHSTMLTFLKNQGACLPHVMPEFLLELDDYKKWIRLRIALELKVQRTELQKTNVKNSDPPNDKHLLVLDDRVFETMSKRVWMDVLLQVYKVLVLPRVSPLNISNLFGSETMPNMPRINTEPSSSNIYSSYERIVLTWLNKHYEKNRKIVWKNCQKGEVPPVRWIVNFDRDLLDGLVLAAQVAAYCPYLISTHFVNMYTNPETPEQCLHNCLILVSAFRVVSLDIDIQATDICDPNPVMMLMLCVYLYEILPQYLPKRTIEFTGTLHATLVKQVRLKNPSFKPLIYSATIVGRECADFSLPKGNTVVIAPKSQISINIEFTSRFLHAAEAMLLLVSKAVSEKGGATITFSLKTKVNHIEPAGVFRCKSPCYELKKVSLTITNPFRTNGIFRVILVESTSYLSVPEQLYQASQVTQSETPSFESTVPNNKSDVVNEDALENQENNLRCSNQSNGLQEFFSPACTLVLEGRSSAVLDVYFLPFNLGKRYCTIILINELIGEFVYLVEGTGGIPLPSGLLPMDSPNVLCNSSTSEGGVNEGHSGVQPVLCLKCGLTDILEEKLKIPLINEARERALAIAAQQQMSALEYERRKVTGTLESSSVRVAVAALGLSKTERDELNRPLTYSQKLKSVDYSIEVNMPEYFEVPAKLSIPVLATSRVNFKVSSKEDHETVNMTDDSTTVELRIRFVPKYPGRYPCQILLHSSYDIRVYTIECVVNADSAEVELEFITSAYQTIIQDIPISNLSSQDWKLKAILEGHFFYGPPLIYVGPGETTQYSLMFKPTSECITTGKLILQNETDGTEHIFSLKGIGKKPLALDHIVIDCQVRQNTQKVLMVPNFTKKKLTYKVTSNLPVIGGTPTLTVEPDDTAAYTLNVFPWKRGILQGVISFAAEFEEQQQPQHNKSPEETDGEQGLQKLSTETLQTVDAANTGGKTSCCQVWFSLEINSMPAAPERILEVKCTVLNTTKIDIPITNPTDESLQLNVVLTDAALSGETALVLKPNETLLYEMKYSPAVIGTSDGSVIFLSEAVGEFWYMLKLIVEEPLSTTLPEIACELGKSVRLYVPLPNPTYETLKLEIFNSNPGNFSIEADPSKPLIVAPQSTTEVPVQFCPSALGRANHQASVTFMCPQLNKWVFHLLGVGLIPQPMEPASISTCVGRHSSIIIPFKNPTSEDILVDVLLTDHEQPIHRVSASVVRKSFSKESAFHLPLKQTQGILLSPKSTLDIPVLFMPDTMKLYEAVVVVHVVKENGENWLCEDLVELNKELKSVTLSENGEIYGIRWIYPINGIPEAPPQKLVPAVVRCQARQRVEERVEVLLTGVVPGTTSMPTARNATTTTNKSSSIQDEVQVTAGFSTTDEFLYEIQYKSNKVKSQLESSVAINLVQKDRNAESGIITLIFNIIFAPNKPMRNSATLMVQCTTGGIWKFPILLIATEPDVDDVINIEAAGLNKESLVGFRLTSQTRYPEPFMAYFLPGSDPEFVVLPQDGELLPLDTVGTPITVGFKPSMYSKKHKAILVIQTSSMQWTYEINGLPPQTKPPTTSAKVISTGGYIRSATVRQRNFLRENLKLITTGASSPIKGAPLVLKTK